MSYADLAHQRFQLIVEHPGIGAGLQDHRVCLTQMGASSGGKTFEAKATWGDGNFPEVVLISPKL